MKIKESHCRLIEQHISAYVKKLAKPLSFFVEEYKKNNFTPKRFRWDVLHCATSQDESMDLFDTIYQYANDDNLDTVLRNCLIDDNWTIKI